MHIVHPEFADDGFAVPVYGVDGFVHRVYYHFRRHPAANICQGQFLVTGQFCIVFKTYPNVFFRIIAATVSGFIVPDYQCLFLCLDARKIIPMKMYMSVDLSMYKGVH